MNSTPDAIFPNLHITIETLNNVAFSIFGFEIYKYGLIITTGIILGFFIAGLEAKRVLHDQSIIEDFIPLALIFAIIGARIYYVVFSWDTYKGDLLSMFNIRNGGIAIYGAIISSVTYAYFYCKKKNIDFLVFADICAPGLVLGQAIGRNGNFFNMEAFGRFTNSFFKLQYIKEKVSPSLITPDIAQNLQIINNVEYIQVHPTFLYEVLWNIGVFITLMLIRKRKKFNGQLIATYFLLYGLGRFWIESLRTDQLILFNTGLAASQVLSGLIIFFSTAFIIFKLKKAKQK